jgi:hypothetical protein
MTFKLLITLIYICIFSLNSFANENIIVIGHGSNTQIATQNGLIEAIKQKHGIQITINEVSNLISLNSNNAKKKNYQNSLKRDLSVKSGGYITEYKILKTNYNEALKEYEVELNVKFAHYDLPSEDASRRRIFIDTFQSSDCQTSCSKNTDSQKLKRFLINDYTDTRKFAVLDRDNETTYQKETDLILSDRVSSKEKSRLNKVWATDYILTGSIKKITYSNTQEHIKLTGETIHNKTAKITVDYQISLYASQQIKYASQATISLNKAEMQNLTRDETISLLLKKASAQIVEKTIDAIYPPVVIQKNGKDVIINISGSTTIIGKQYDVFNASSENLIDPYTKENLGRIETFAATIKIKDTKPKYSIATVVKGNIKDIQLGAICRKKQGGK